ncbi:MAG TPA: hypothetical protein VNY51_07490 [Candidatus Dormibacteraeota bacterium]|jgi:hypothetical protein|nr:hypothetical protein [Candidatus Dormibacteraeota bacterium]
MPEKILLVDDDHNILEGYRRSLSREFLMETALGRQAQRRARREGRKVGQSQKRVVSRLRLFLTRILFNLLQLKWRNNRRYSSVATWEVSLLADRRADN